MIVIDVGASRCLHSAPYHCLIIAGGVKANKLELVTSGENIYLRVDDGTDTFPLQKGATSEIYSNGFKTCTQMHSCRAALFVICRYQMRMRVASVVSTAYLNPAKALIPTLRPIDVTHASPHLLVNA